MRTHPCPLDWEEYRSKVDLVRQVADAAMREIGGRISADEKTVYATAPGQAQRAFLLGLQAAGIAYEIVPWDEWRRQMDEHWHGAGYVVRSARGGEQ